RRVGELNLSVVQRFVDEIVTLPDREIFEAMIWVMERCKLMVEGAAAAPVGALLHGLVQLPPGSRVVAVLSGGNLNLDQLRGLKWNLAVVNRRAAQRFFWAHDDASRRAAAPRSRSTADSGRATRRSSRLAQRT